MLVLQLDLVEAAAISAIDYLQNKKKESLKIVRLKRSKELLMFKSIIIIQ